MQYLVFGVLLIFGAFVIGLSLFIYHAKNLVKAVVVESRCEIKRDEKKIESIKITHTLNLTDGQERRNIETDMIPVREIKDAEMKLYFDKNTQQVYFPEYSKYLPLLGAFVLGGVLCLVQYAVKYFEPVLRLNESELLAVLSGGIAVVAFSYVCRLLNPSIVKSKGSFEGILKQEDGNQAVEIYSLWYGKHRQYAKRISGMLLRDKGKPVVLFYNTRSGTVFRVQEILLSALVCAGAVALMVTLLII